MKNFNIKCSIGSIVLLLIFAGSCKDPVIPTVTTNAASAITQTTATAGGDVTSDGEAGVTARGVCWSTSQNPTTADSKTTNGTGTGTFSSSITGLSAGTPYYMRAYADNSAGTGYGNQVLFTTTDSNAFARTRSGILGYFNECIANNKIIIGQQVNGGNEIISGWNEEVLSLKALSGKTPALLGFEYGYVANMNYSLNNQYVINHWNAGGLVTINCSMDCPWVAGYKSTWDSYENRATIDLSKMLKNAPASAEKTSYRNELMAVGNALKALKNAGVIVLWRPFHEMNANFFWWGANHWTQSTNFQAYKDLWIDMYNTYTTDLGLDNLIWVYAPSPVSIWSATLTDMYPGSEYVDVVGVDIYGKPPHITDSDYNALLTLGKPVAITECGASAGSGNVYYDSELQVLEAYKSKAAYFLQWGGEISEKVNCPRHIAATPGAKEAMNHPSAITLENIPK